MSTEILLPELGIAVASAQERRADLRHFVEAKARCRRIGAADKGWTGTIRDVSSLGVGILTGEEIKVGSLLEIDLENKKGNWIGAIRARVVHVQPADNQWLVGCAFIAELDDAELRFFEAEKLAPPSSDGRRWVRYPCNVETVLYTAETVPGERRRANIVNISAGGVGLLLPCEFSAGTILRLELPLHPAQAARLLLVRVIRCVAHGKRGWFLGCEFADQLAPAQLNHLLED